MKYLSLIIGGLLLSLLLTNAAYSAEQAQKPKVRNVSFSGNITYPDSRLEGLMLTRPSRFLATKHYHPEVFHDDMETLIAFYRQNGFLQAHITDTIISIDSLNNEVDISISLEEGARTFVEGITIFGNRFFPDSILMNYIGLRAGDPLRRPLIEDAVFNLLAHYAENGFLDASVNPKVQVNDSAQLALIDFNLNERDRSLVGKISISGAKRTRSNVILRELSFSRGDIVKYSELVNSQRRLYLTGLFESVFVRPAPIDSGEWMEREIRVDLIEKPSSELAFSIGYGTIEKVRGRAEINTSSLSGTARKLGFGVEANFIKQSASLSFSEPWTLGTRWRTDVSVFGQLRQEPAYHSETAGGKLTLGRNLGAQTSLRISYRLENTNLSKIDLTTPVDEPDPRIRSLSLALEHDTRDNLFDPSDGWYVNWANEIAGSFLHGSNTFVRSVMTVKKFLPAGRQTVFGSSVEMGWMEAFGQSDEIPVSERFYTGGPTSLRGFGYQMVGPMDINGEPLGGRMKLVWNLLEIRRSIYRIFGGVVFVELGNVWSSPATARFSDLRLDAGSGLRINSPLGILRLDYGFNLDRRRGESGAKLFFSMGQAF